MLLRYTKPSRFLFISNTKTASSAIHEYLPLHVTMDIRINNSHFGKHFSLTQIVSRYDFIFEKASLDEFLKVMIIREPLDWLMSWYNYRSIPALRKHPSTSYGMSFEAFIENFINTSAAQPQINNVLLNNEINVDYLIPYSSNLNIHINNLCKYLNVTHNLDVGFGLEKVNESPKHGKVDLYRGSELESEIKKIYTQDYEAIDNIAGINDKFLSILKS